MTGLEALREAMANPWVRLALKVRMATAVDVQASERLLNFLKLLRAEAAALKEAAGKIDELMATAAWMPQSKRLRDFLDRLRLEAIAIKAGAEAKIDQPETMTALVAQARKMTIEGALECAMMSEVREGRIRIKADDDAADVRALEAYLRDGTVTPGYTFVD